MDNAKLKCIYTYVLNQISFPVIYLCHDDVRPFLIRACALGMCNGEFLFIFVNVEAGWDMTYPWRKNDSFDEIAKEAFKYMIHVSTVVFSR